MQAAQGAPFEGDLRGEVLLLLAGGDGGEPAAEVAEPGVVEGIVRGWRRGHGGHETSASRKKARADST